MHTLNGAYATGFQIDADFILSFVQMGVDRRIKLFCVSQDGGECFVTDGIRGMRCKTEG